MSELPRGNFHVVHLVSKHWQGDASWAAAWELVRRKLVANKILHLPHGQREAAMVFVGAYVALGGEIEGF